MEGEKERHLVNFRNKTNSLPIFNNIKFTCFYKKYISLRKDKT